MGTGMIERERLAQSKQDVMTFANAFSVQMTSTLSDKHTFASVMLAPPTGSFSKSERIIVLAVFIFGSMLTNAMFYQTDGSELSLSQAIYVGFMSALIAVIPTTIIVYVFKHSAVRQGRLLSNTSNRIHVAEAENADDAFSPTKQKSVWGEGVSKNHKTRKGNDPAPPKNRRRSGVWVKPPKDAPTRSTSGSDATNLANDDRKPGVLAACKRTAVAMTSDDALPVGFRYLAWVFSVLFCLFASYTLLLYSFQWGQAMSLAWLGSFFTSLLMSICFFDPITILLLGMLGAYLMREIKTTPINQAVCHDRDTLVSARKRVAKPDLQYDQSTHVYKISPEYQQVLKARLERENSMSSIIRQLIVHVLFYCGLAITIYAGGTGDGFRLVESLRVTLTQAEKVHPDDMHYDVEDSPFMGMATHAEYWEWAESVIGSRIHTNTKAVPNTTANWFGNYKGSLVMLGAARLRQLRVKGEACESSWLNTTECRYAWSGATADTQPGEIGWKGSGASNPTYVNNASKPWAYTFGKDSVADLVVFPQYPVGDMIGADGYMHTIPTNGPDALALMKDLKAKGWTDHYTRTIILELTVYAAAADVIIPAQLIMEFPPTGGIISTAYFRPFLAERYHGSGQILLILADLVIGIVTACSLGQLIVDGRNNGWRSILCSGPSLLQVALTLTTLVTLGLNTSQVFVQKRVMRDFSSQSRDIYFDDFVLLGVLNQASLTMSAVAMGFATAKFASLLRHDSRTKMLGRVLSVAVSALGTFLFLLSITFFAFALTGTLLFGGFLYKFSTMWRAMITLLDACVTMTPIAIGNVDHDLRILVRLYFTVFCILIVWHKMNLFVTILNGAMNYVTNRYGDDMSTDLDLWRYVCEQIRLLLGIPSKFKIKRPPTDMSNELDVINKQLRIIVDRTAQLVTKKKRVKMVSVKALDLATQLTRQQREARVYIHKELTRMIKTSRSLFGKKVKNVDDLILAADRDGNGNISKMEWKNIIKRYGIHISAAMFNALYASMQPDKDNCISFKSIQLLMKTTRPPIKRQMVVGKRAMGGFWLRNQTKPPAKPKSPPVFQDFVDANGIRLNVSPRSRSDGESDMEISVVQSASPGGEKAWGPSTVLQEWASPLPSEMRDVKHSIPDPENPNNDVPILNVVYHEERFPSVPDTSEDMAFLKTWKQQMIIAHEEQEKGRTSPFSPTNGKGQKANRPRRKASPRRKRAPSVELAELV